jgi:hypothetical protein
VTDVEVEACSWTSYGSTANMPWRGGSPQVAAKAQELLSAGLQPGQVQFYRFTDTSGIFQFYLARDGRNVMVDRCNDGVVGVGQEPEGPSSGTAVGLGQTVNPDGTVTIGDITYTPPTSGPSTQGWTPGVPGSTTITPDPGGGSVVTSTTAPPGVQLPPANQTQPGTQTGGGSWGPYPSAPLATAAAPAAGTNTGLLVAGLAAVAVGIGGIMYLAHARTAGARA